MVRPCCCSSASRCCCSSASPLAVYLPSLVRGERIAPGQPPVENQWLGGPRTGTAELKGPESEDADAGGASGRW